MEERDAPGRGVAAGADQAGRPAGVDGASPGFTSAFTMATGVLAAQAISLASAPLLSRLYQPSDFGALATIIAIAGGISIVSTGRYELAIVASKSDQEVTDLVVATVASAISVAIAAALVLLIHQRHWSFSAPASPGPGAVAALAVCSILLAVGQVADGVATRGRHYASMAKALVARQASLAVTALALGGLISGAFGLVCGTIVGMLCYVTWLLRPLLGAWPSGRSALDGRRMAATLRSLRRFPAYSMPFSLLQSISRDLLIFAFALTQDSVAAGLLALARTVVWLPLSLLSGSLSPVYFREAVSRAGASEFAQFTLRLSRAVAVAFVPAFTFLAFWSEDIFAWGFGERWRVAGAYAAALCVPAIIMGQICWPNRIFEVRGRQSWLLTSQALFDVLTVAALVAAYLAAAPPLSMVWVYAICQAAGNLAILLMEFRLAGLPVRRTVELLALCSAAGALVWLAGLVSLGTGIGALAAFCLHGLLAGLLSAFGGAFLLRQLLRG